MTIFSSEKDYFFGLDSVELELAVEEDPSAAGMLSGVYTVDACMVMSEVMSILI